MAILKKKKKKKKGGGLYSTAARNTTFLDLSILDHLVGLEVRRPPRERKVPGSNPAGDGIFSGSSHTSDLKKMALQWIPCQAPGVI